MDDLQRSFTQVLRDLLSQQGIEYNPYNEVSAVISELETRTAAAIDLIENATTTTELTEEHTQKMSS